MLTSVFGISIKYEAWNHQDSLPVYIAGSYDFHTAYIGNKTLYNAYSDRRTCHTSGIEKAKAYLTTPFRG